MILKKVFNGRAAIDSELKSRSPKLKGSFSPLSAFSFEPRDEIGLEERPALAFKKNSIQKAFMALFILASVIVCSLPSQLVMSDCSVLCRSIIDYNSRVQHESLSNGSYKGAAGILRIKPEVARPFGLNVLIDQDYLDAIELDDKADRLFNEAILALTSQEEERAAGEHAKRAGESALASTRCRISARKHFEVYRSRLTSQVDERLSREVCSRLMDRLLKESLQKSSFDLRDGLGIFYNRCQGVSEDTPSLTPENVRFVNHVFSEFLQKGSEADKEAFYLGRQSQERGMNPGSSLKAAVSREAPRLGSLIESCLNKEESAEYPVDPLLFIALMRRESNFDPLAVSYVGAAGLTQIMPKTGKGLGMKQIFMPAYFEEANSLLKRERDLRQKAISIISRITPANLATQARLAREFMQTSLDCSKKRSILFARYRKELLEKRQDDRLDPCKAISYGYRYFSGLMKMQKGDISLALASYNAGPHRVTQYNGLPPFAETVTFRNTVLKYYREYLEKLKGAD